MNAQKFTQKSLLAIQQAQDTALSYGQMQIEEIHLLHALLTQEEGLIPQLITKMGKDPAAFTKAVEEAIRRLPSSRRAPSLSWTFWNTSSGSITTATAMMGV